MHERAKTLLPVGQRCGALIASMPGNLDDVGARLRWVRMRAGLGLRSAADQSGLAPSALSRIERGERTITVHQLISLASLYMVSTDVLLGIDVSGSLSTIEMPQCRSSQVLLSPPQCGVDARRLSVQSTTATPRTKSHPGRVSIHVLAGTLRIKVGTRLLLRRAGESIAFDTAAPHWFAPPLGTSAEVITLLTRTHGA